ncbi:MAG TPA: methyltransferase domain-containing protein [Terriglobia bacterium]|nr:methyltransferase domain-containing protein [Terriglobia bacterium]
MGERLETPTPEWNAELYDQKHSFVWQYGGDLVNLLSPQPGEYILDLGCGTGHLTAQIAEAGAHVVGVDSAITMIEQARAHFPALQFELADAQDFHFSEPFDAVFSNAVLHWIVAATRVAGSVSRALKPGGRFVAEFGGRGCVKAILAACRIAQRELGIFPETDLYPWYFPSVAEYSSVLEAQGLVVTSAWLIDRPTKLEDGELGLRHWIKMFCNNFLSTLSQNKQEDFFLKLDEVLRPKLFRDGSWIADYKRLRIVAIREMR